MHRDSGWGQLYRGMVTMVATIAAAADTVMWSVMAMTGMMEMAVFGTVTGAVRRRSS